MREILARGMVDVLATVERIATLLSEWEDPLYSGKRKYNPSDAVEPQTRHWLSKSYKSVAEAADVLGSPLTSMAAARAKKRVLERKDVITWNNLKAINSEIRSRFDDELQTVKLYCLAKGADAYYNPEGPLFGTVVAARIPKASDDISEGGKCFATGRYTASVFHLMRAMEAAVQKMSERLEIPNVEREWGKLLSDIHKKIEPMEKGETRDNWSQVHANLYHVKQAWRNDTMHPKATYTEEEAREVFDAMKAFMRHLASMLPFDLSELA